MNTPLRVVSFLNQFFGGIGGEDKADMGVSIRDQPVGPGMAIQTALGDSGTVVGTVIAGDNYMAEQIGSNAGIVARAIAELRPDVLVAGPAFGSGRYGMSCGVVCAAVEKTYGIPAVTAMHESNPGLELFRASTVIVPAAPTAAGMRAAVTAMVQTAVLRAQGKALPAGSYFLQGVRALVQRDKSGAERAVDMLLQRLGDTEAQHILTELPLPSFDTVEPAPALASLHNVTIVLITEGGLVPSANPDRIEMSMATKYGSYEIKGLNGLNSTDFTVAHGGYDNSAAQGDPNRLLPLDALRALEHEGLCHAADIFYTTAGNATSVVNAVAFGQGIAADIRQRFKGLVGAVLTST